jgi:hypothetical protein
LNQRLSNSVLSSAAAAAAAAPGGFSAGQQSHNLSTNCCNPTYI